MDELVRSRQRETAVRQRLQATLDSLLDPHVVIEAVRDPQGGVVDCRYLAANAMACRAIGLPLERLLGARMLPLAPAMRDQELFGRFLHTLESGEPLAIDNLVIAEALGQPLRHYDLRLVKLGDGLVVTWLDMTERVEMSETIDLLTRSSGWGGAAPTSSNTAAPVPAIRKPGPASWPARRCIARSGSGRRTAPCTGWRAMSRPISAAEGPLKAWCSPAA